MKLSDSKTQLQKGALDKLWIQCGSIIAGVDEVGRGCLAGPVVAGCAKLNYDKLWSLPPKTLNLIRDSKTLSSHQRKSILDSIRDISFEVTLGSASEREIEALGIGHATFLAMNRAISALKLPATHILVDGNQIISNQTVPQTAVIKGDRLCYAIAAASIVAKEFRDQLMVEQSVQHPDYGFESNAGYGTSMHIASIKSRGICSLHRKNFAPIRQMLLDH
ncbi:MAG: ribonuclease HII [Proteobacteria bacterium]|nr:ribonuclease HII [Pseudomonadota bacterium]